MLTDEQRAAYPFVVLCNTCGVDVVRFNAPPVAGGWVRAADACGLDGEVFVDGETMPHCPGCGDDRWLDPLPAVRDETRHGERGGHAEGV